MNVFNTLGYASQDISLRRNCKTAWLMWKWHMLMRTSGNINSSAEIFAKSLSTIKQHVKQVTYLLAKAVNHFAINFICYRDVLDWLFVCAQCCIYDTLWCIFDISWFYVCVWAFVFNIGHWLRLCPTRLHWKHTMLLVFSWSPLDFLHSMLQWFIKPQMLRAIRWAWNAETGLRAMPTASLQARMTSYGLTYISESA